MQSPTLVKVNHHDHGQEIFTVTMEYFDWINAEIIRLCGVSIPDMAGQPLDLYVRDTVGTICSGVPPEGVFYLMQDDGVTVGTGGLRRLSDGSAEIVRLYTRPQFRGRGYGRQILAQLLADAQDFGYTVAKLDTGEFMHSAQRIYESFGFEDCPPYEGAEASPLLHQYWRFMSKRLI